MKILFKISTQKNTLVGNSRTMTWTGISFKFGLVSISKHDENDTDFRIKFLKNIQYGEVLYFRHFKKLISRLKNADFNFMFHDDPFNKRVIRTCRVELLFNAGRIEFKTVRTLISFK